MSITTNSGSSTVVDLPVLLYEVLSPTLVDEPVDLSNACPIECLADNDGCHTRGY